jgi:hypothetical protein
MGMFTVLISALLIVGQFTTLVFDRTESTWGFYFLHARPDIAYWRPALDRILSTGTAIAAPAPPRPSLADYAHDGLPANTTTTAAANNSHSSNSSNSTDGGGGGGGSNASSIMIVGKRAGIMLCMQSIAMVSSPVATSSTPTTGGGKGSEQPEHEAFSRHAYQCLLRAHTPQIGVAVMGLFNPHLALLAVGCLQFLICLGRMEYKRANTAPSVNDIGQWMPVQVPLWSIGVVLILLIVAASAIQAVHSTELLQYPTVIFVVVWMAIGAAYVKMHTTYELDLPWELAFQLQTVAVPVALLAYAIFGTRLWADMLTHGCLLSAAVNLLWLQLHKGAPVWLARFMVIGLTLLSLHGAQLQFGPFDTWRYALTFMACLGLAPLLLLSITSSEPMSWQLWRQYHSSSLMASNVALLSLMVSVSHIV